MEAVESPKVENPAPVPTDAPPAPAPEAKPQESFSKHFAALANKEKALQKEREAYKAERAAWEAERAKFAPPPAPKAKTPLEELEGEVTPDSLAKATKAELAAFRREWEEKQKEAADQAKAESERRANETVETFKSSIVDYVAENPESCELIALNNAQHLIYDTIEEFFAKNQRVLSIKEASELVEKYIEGQLKEILAKSKKLKAVVEPPKAAEPKPTAPNRTLNNGMTPQTPTFVHNSSIQDDAFQRAMKALG